MAHFFKTLGEDFKKAMNEMDEEMSPDDVKKKDDAALQGAIEAILADPNIAKLDLNAKDALKAQLEERMQKIVDQSFQDGFSCGYMNGSMVSDEEGFE